MQETNNWTLVGNANDLIKKIESSGGLIEVSFENKKIVLTYFQDKFGALNNKCNHMGGPLSKGKLKNGCVVCPWHYWQFNHATGESLSVEASKHFTSTAGSVPSFPLKVEGDSLFIDLTQESKRVPAAYNMKSNLGREPKREAGKIRVLGISTTAMDKENPRFSTSEELLRSSLDKAAAQLDVDTKFIALSDLNFRNCEGFYSKSEKACTWPCSITKMDPTDQMNVVYENLVHWADVVIVSSPIRWGGASSLYYKMAERLNSVQNQITTKNKVLIQNKVVSLIITGGQDNIQSVAGQMLTFFGELGFSTPAFPFVAHSLGWSSEDMERNMDYVKESDYLHEESLKLVERSVELARKLI
ncbi:NAD(P)H-dependent oxidoreductase [bacterium]|nr:NAD(P)H-dependent oxidoreductase [bacterium]